MSDRHEERVRQFQMDQGIDMDDDTFQALAEQFREVERETEKRGRITCPECGAGLDVSLCNCFTEGEQTAGFATTAETGKLRSIVDAGDALRDTEHKTTVLGCNGCVAVMAWDAATKDCRGER